MNLRSIEHSVSSISNIPFLPSKNQKASHFKSKAMLIRELSPYGPKNISPISPRSSKFRKLQKQLSEVQQQELEMLKLYRNNSEEDKRNQVIDQASKWSKFKEQRRQVVERYMGLRVMQSKFFKVLTQITIQKVVKRLMHNFKVHSKMYEIKL